MSNAPRLAAYLHVDGYENFQKIDFNRKEVRAGFARAGREVQREAKRLVSKEARSKRGEYPARMTGALIRSIRVRVSRPGFLVRVAPQKTGAMSDFYPAFLFYGVKSGARVGRAGAGEGRGKSGRRLKGETARLKAERRGGGWRIAPRKNFMADALDNRAGRVRAILRRAFDKSLK